MDSAQFAEFLQLGREQHSVEFKGAHPRTDRLFFAKVVRAILGMANRRDGGYIVIGVEERESALDPVGLDAATASTWTFESLTAGLAEYADPHVEVDLRNVAHENRLFLSIRVEEFEDVPVLCRKTYQSATGVILREGACYVRPRRKLETSEIATYADMRELIDLATEKNTRRFIQRAAKAGILQLGSPAATDEDLFAHQRDFLK
jgi:predicted HTH transcriptional regulator